MHSFLIAALFSAQPFLTPSAPRLHTPGPGFERRIKRKRGLRTRTITRTRIIRKTVRKTIPLKIKVYAARSLTIDLLVTCRRNHVMITFSRIGKQYCTPKQKCYKTLSHAVRPYCLKSTARKRH